MRLCERAHILLKEVEYEKIDEELIGHSTRNQQRYKSSISPPYSQEPQHNKPYRRQAYSISIAAITKKGKHQSTVEESDKEDEQNLETVAKCPKKVAAITQTLHKNSPETQSWVWEIEISEDELN
jgi:hypothetical protein